MQTSQQEKDIRRAIEESFAPVKSALENVGWTVKLNAFAARFDYRAGGHVHISSHLREHWGCQLTLHACWKTGKIERITVQARPARTVTIKYSEKALPGLLSRIQACFDADVEDEARRKRDSEHSTQWAAQAIRDFKDYELPECLVPSWFRDSEKPWERYSHLHRGMARTPVGRYFPQIDESALITYAQHPGAEGLTAGQIKFLSEALKKLKEIE